MGNDISVQYRLTDNGTVPATFNESLTGPEKIRSSLHDPDEISAVKTIDADYRLTEIKNSPEMSDDLENIQNTPKLKITDLTGNGQSRIDKHERRGICQTKFIPGNCDDEYENKLKAIRQTLMTLDDSLRETRSLEAEQSLRYSQLKTKNISLQIDLEKSEKRNKNMLNLFRQNASEIGFGRLRASSTLPESLKKDVQRIWSQKYDALLEQNNQLKKEAAKAELVLKDKDKQVEDLQQRLLNLAEDLIQREKTIAQICTKFLSLKQRKDEQEVLLRGSVETLQDALQKAKNAVTSSKSESSMVPSKDVLIAREIRRSDRLAHENSLLRSLLQEAKRSCRSSRTSSTISLCDKNV